MAALGNQPPARVTVNEFTTIATVWTHNQFIDGTTIAGSPLALRIAAGNVPNFVDLATGGYGTAIQDGLNSSQTPTMANFATLANLLAGCTTRVTADACAKLFAAATSPTGAVPADTLAVAEAIARNPAHQADQLFALLNAFYPVPQGKKMRATPFTPYLSFAPSAWVLPLKFVGGGVSGGGKLMFDSQGNVWHADRFGSSERGRLKLVELMAAYAAEGEEAATESLVNHLSAQKPGYWDGGSVTVLRPDGSKAPFSPVSGQGLGGPWVVAVDGNDNIWVSNFTSAMAGNLVQLCGVRTETSPQGTKTGDAISPPGGYVGGGMQQLVDVGVGPAGDVWLTNNWEIDAAGLGKASEALSTRGAGQGVVVFFGVAKPVTTPLIGPPRPAP